MKKKIAKKWIKALKSGKYSPTKTVIRDYEGHCCLGVLCDISDLGKWQQNGPGFTYETDNSVSLSFLPREVREWAGLKSDTGRISVRKNLSVWNDEGMSFKKIAKRIKKYRKKL